VSTLAVDQLQLAPLGAGDLIDRTVRLYRRHFMPLIRASAPPIIVQTIGVVIWTIGIQAAGNTGGEGKLILYFLLALLGLVLRFVGFIFQLIVLGGATRNLVMHLLSAEPVKASTIYRNVRSRFWGLLGATTAMVLCALLSLGVAFFAMFLLQIIFLLMVAFVINYSGLESSWIITAVSLIFTLATLILALYIFFFLAGRVAYVPQVMMVEGMGVFAAISRSASLAKGNVRRLMGMFLFTTFATFSVQALFIIPLGWFAYLSGVDLLEFDTERIPAWYSVGYQVAFQMGAILLAPIWTLGLSLLYVDERVRHEGYDVELMAAQRLGEMPSIPAGINSPLAPAIVMPTNKAKSNSDEAPALKRSDSVLGLMD
jgi:hypothetical protein